MDLAHGTDLSWRKVPTILDDVLNQAGYTIDDAECRRLAVEACEATILEFRHCASDHDAPPARAIGKLYHSRPQRVESDAQVLTALHQRGLKVPAVLAVLPAHGLILLEWCGRRTLADLLKAGDPVGHGLWSLVIDELARLHQELDSLWAHRDDFPAWQFTPDQRRDWAIEGATYWLSWLPDGELARTIERLRSSPSGFVDRLVGSADPVHVIWGDCNPKNILVDGSDICFIDFQLKRSTRMMDLILLFAFADSPSTYVPRNIAHQLLRRYHSGCPDSRGIERLLQAYDDELLWRILVYGGMLIHRRQERLEDWESVVSCFAQELPTLVGYCE